MNPKREFAQGVREILAKDPRYRFDAYAFVSEAVGYTAKKLRRSRETSRHVSGKELVEGIRELALERFGPLSMQVLNEWGVERTEDFGNIVFNLVGHQLLGASENDSPGDFSGGYDFHDAFVKPFAEPGTIPTDLPKII